MHLFERVSNRLARQFATLFGKAEWSATIGGAGTVTIRTNSSDLSVFNQVFRSKQYDFSQLGQYHRVVEVYEKILAAGGLPVIVDAGANVGAASIWFATEFPGACILAVEPDPGNAAICRRNTQRFPAVNVIEAAIGSKQGTVRLTNPSNQAWMVQTVRGDNGSIPICTISEIVRNAGKSAQLFIVKIDIEGFEDDLFQNDTQWIREAVVVMIEPHDWLFPGRGTSLNFQKILANEEYEILISGENLIYVRLLERGFPNS